MIDVIDKYLHGVEDAIAEYMAYPVSERSMNAVGNLIQVWEKVKCMRAGYTETATTLTEAQAESWNSAMLNSDGTQGGHWTIPDTTEVAQSLNIDLHGVPEYAWNVTMNMMYSDYYDTAAKFGISNAEFYARLAKDFLFDKDGGKPIDKLSAYYHYIAK